MSSTTQLVKRFYDVSVKDLALTVVFIVALAASVGLGIVSRQHSQASTPEQATTATVTSATTVAANDAQDSNSADSEDDQVPPGSPFPTEETPAAPAPAPAPASAPTPQPAPAPSPSSTIPNAGPGETAFALFIATSFVGYVVYSAYLRSKPITFGQPAN